MRTLSVGGRDKIWDPPFCEVFDVLGYSFHRDGKGFQGAERSMCKVLRNLSNDDQVRVHSHDYITVLNGSINWPWSSAMIDKVRVWEAQILRFTFRPRMRPDETWVSYKIRTSRSMRISWGKMGLPLLTEKNVCKIWTTVTTFHL